MPSQARNDPQIVLKSQFCSPFPLEGDGMGVEPIRTGALDPHPDLPRFAGEGIPWRLQLIDLACESGLAFTALFDFYDASI